MTYVITGDCCGDQSCVSVCPVDCIHPVGDGDGTLAVDAAVCIDCGACSDACPVSAAVPGDRLTGPDRVWLELNARVFSGTGPLASGTDFARPAAADLARRATGRQLRVAVVGTGPSAAYTTRALLRADTELTVIDREATPGGLLRGGVAPDHLATRDINTRFATTWRNPRVRLLTGVELGRDLSAVELAAHHDAVVYAVGAGSSRRLGIEGEDLSGSLTAEQVVGWYNAGSHVESLDLDSERAVVVGTGNVALDIARVLLTEPDALEHSAIAGSALAALRTGRLREVVLLARRGPEALACSYGELHSLVHHPGIAVSVEGAEGADVPVGAMGTPQSLLAGLPTHDRDPSAVAGAAAGGSGSPERRLVLRFNAVPESFTGDHEGMITGVRLVNDAEPLPCALVVTAIGYRARPLDGLTIDPATGVAANDDGRVLAPDGSTVTGSYVTGWARRGPTGGIGANRADAEQIVAHLLADAAAGLLTEPRHGRVHLAATLAGRRLRQR